MAFASSVSCSRHNLRCTCSSTSETVKPNAIKIQPCISRRVGSITLISSLVLTATSNTNASAFEFRMTVPDQTAEEAEVMIRDHSRALLDVKFLLEAEDWREAQRELRRYAGYLKQDIYTIIQSKDGSLRPFLRKLYSDLFNNVSKLDYAARDKNVAQVSEYYNNVTNVLNDILSRI
ncbi:psbQ-like protein 3, chloroplastic [Silene latifolia]|uniref:psbQ-like protein 3, chloroplastic n=1 Tax=Silene latifolia TaxID=37657 RepID=UPI003D76E2BE